MKYTFVFELQILFLVSPGGISSGLQNLNDNMGRATTYIALHKDKTFDLAFHV